MGATSARLADGRLTTAATPSAANTASPARPTQSQRTASIPITAANTGQLTTIPRPAAFLSLLPKWAIAKSLTGTGVRLIATPPTAITGRCGGR